MKQHQLYIGIDRSDQTIDICQVDQQGNHLLHSKISSSPELLTQWVAELKEALKNDQTAAICIEQPCQNLVNFFSQFDHLVIYLANPAVIKKYRESLSASRAKDDKRDAAALAQYVFERYRQLKAYKNEDPLSQQIATLVEKRRQLVGQRVGLTNKLTQALKDYYPQAIELVGKYIHSPVSCAFLKKWSSLQKLQKAKQSTIQAFYYNHNSRSKTRIEKRLELIEKAVPMCTDSEVIEVYELLVGSLVNAIESIQKSIQKFDKLIEQKAQQHEDYKIFSNLPGAGPCYASRLLAFFGSDRSKYEDASSVQQNNGVAPVTKQSGKMHFVHRRYACNKFMQQTFVEWAGQTITKSMWAKAYYHQQKAKGHRHQSILRSLAYKWQRILFICWQKNELYDEKTYLKALEKSSSPLINYFETIKQTHPKLCEQFI